MPTWVPLLIGLAAGYAAVRVFGRYPPASGFRRLARREVAFLRAAGDTFFPPGGPLPPSGSDAGVAEYIDEYLGLVPTRMRRLMRMLFFLVEHATLAFPAPGPRGFRRFSSLSPEQREAAIASWRASSWIARRIVFTSLRAVLTNCYVADPAVLRQLGLAPFAIGTPVAEADLLYPPIGARPEAIGKTRASLTPPSDGTPLRPGDPLHPDYAEPAP
jgi:hypothetical protein